MHDSTLHMTMLFDFYGELLTEKQREYFDLYHNEDFSLAEIAERADISRQGVYDIIRRSEKTLIDTEQKTKIIERWLGTRELIDKIEKIATEIAKHADDEEISELASQLQHTIAKLKV